MLNLCIAFSRANQIGTILHLMPRGLLACAATITFLLGPCLFPRGLTGTASAAIYWQSGSGAIGRANLDGSNADPDFIPNPNGPGTFLVCGGVAVDGAHIYWADNQRGTIGRANLDGSNADDNFIAGVSSPCGVAVDSSHVYWTNYEEETIGRAELDGANVQQRFLNTGPRACGLATFGSDLYWASPPSRWIGRVASDGSKAPDLYIPEVDAGCGIAISDEYIYWTDFEGSIGRSLLNGTQVTHDFISGLLQPCGIAVHDDWIYWSEKSFGGIGTINRVNIDGSNVQSSFIPGIRNPCGVAADDVAVPPKPDPSREFGHLSLGPIKHNRRRSAVLVAIDVSTPGLLSISVPRAMHSRLIGGLPNVGAGRHWLKVVLGPGSASTWPRDVLRRTGRARFTLIVGFFPVKGPTKSVAKKVSMLRMPVRRPQSKR